MTRIVYKYSYRPTAEYVNNVTEKNTTTQSIKHKNTKRKGKEEEGGEGKGDGKGFAGPMSNCFLLLLCSV